MIEVRNKLKAKKPVFIRHDSHKKVRVSNVWRKPKGRQNKMRLNKKGYARSRSTGYSSPKLSYGLSREGFIQTVITSITQLAGLDPKKNAIIVSRTLGLRRKQEIILAANKQNIKILNIDIVKFEEKVKNIAAKKKAHQKNLSARQETKSKAAKKEKEEKSKEKDKDSVKVAKETSKIPVGKEVKKLQEKKEKDKILTKKE